MLTEKDIIVPLDVLAENRQLYISNYLTATKHSGRLMLFAGDQKIEHLNADFSGDGISPEDNDPEHMFKIASQGRIGAFASQLGLIARYGMDYPDIPYIIKLNSKTNLVKTSQSDPKSLKMAEIDQVIEFKKNSKLNIVGVGYTLYLGSDFETEMLGEASRIIYQAHLQGFITIIWCYPRGKAVPDEKSPDIIAGAAGVAACLGADFVKVNAPKKEGVNSVVLLQQATKAAGRTKLVCAGGSASEVGAFLSSLYDQIHTGGAMGNATGRNIHQKSLGEAVRFCNAISAITIDDKTVADALAIYNAT